MINGALFAWWEFVFARIMSLSFIQRKKKQVTKRRNGTNYSHESLALIRLLETNKKEI